LSAISVAAGRRTVNMAGECVQRESKGFKAPLSRRRRRIAIRIDMTPMVDIAFLLLIFYMVTTVFSMPQAMEINLPPDDEPQKVRKLLTIRVDRGGKYWWNLGMPTPDNLPEMLSPEAAGSESAGYRLDCDTLRGLLVEQNREYSNLNTLVLIHPDAPFTAMVDILDEIDLIERSFNAFTADQLGIRPEELSRKDRFSYRYAMGTWENPDDRLIAAAEQKAGKGGE
jgi:biopolymer transport protein ExbD